VDVAIEALPRLDRRGAADAGAVDLRPDAAGRQRGGQEVRVDLVDLVGPVGDRGR